MAQKTWVTLIDDIDGTEGDESVLFGLDGVSYEIDLSERNAAALRDALAPYLASARRAGRAGVSRGNEGRGAAARSRRGSRADRPAEPGEMRAWGRENGWTVSERGRIPSDLAAAYAEAH
jgi:hypothetical protein